MGLVKQLLQDPSISKVYATYRTFANAGNLTVLTKEYSDRLVCLQVDVTDETQIAEKLKQIHAEVATLHRVIYCVGLLHEGKLQPEKSLRQIESDHLLRYFQVNSIGAILFAKHLLPLFSHDDRSIFASISAKIGSIGDNYLGGWYGYRASKAALNMFMRTTAIEYKRKSPHTIVVTLHPGTTDTHLSQPFQKNVPPSQLFSVERTVNQLSAVMNNLTVADSGEFFSWDGSRLPW